MFERSSSKLKEARILIVEDESVVAWHVQEALHKIGHEVVAIAKSAREAIQAAEEKKPDLVLMDICLQGEDDGVNTAEYLYLKLDLPVVYLTAHADEQTLHRATETSPFGYLVKPFQEADLHSTIQIALRRHQLEQALKAVQQWYATTLISIGDATIATDVDGFVAFMNPTAEVLTGWMQEESLGAFASQVLDLIQELTCDAIENPILAALCGGDTVTLSEGAVLRSRDGSDRSIAGSAAPIRDRSGEIIGGVLIFQDISDRRQLEQQLQQENDSLERTQDQLTVQLRERTVQLQLAISCTQLLKRVLEQSRFQPRPSERWQIVLHELAQMAIARYSWIVFHDVEHNKGAVTYEWQPVEAEPKHTLLGETVDIQESARFYLRLFQRAAWINPTADVIPPCYQPLLSAKTQLLVLPIADEQQVIGEIGIVSAHPFPWEPLQIELMTQAIGQVAIAFKQADQTAQAQVQIEELNQMSVLNENFLRTFAHELRTPLTNMRMAVEMIQRISQMLRLNRLQSASSTDTLLLWDKLERYVAILQAEWKEECRLIGDLQEFQSAEVGNQSLPLADVQLQVWLPDVIFRFMEQSEYEHRLSYSIPTACIAIVVPLSTLERVVLELLRAICMITPESDEIRITVEQKDAQTKITVQHLESDLPELGQRWQGLELRLALAQKLAIVLRGTIELDQSYKQTQVILTLPL